MMLPMVLSSLDNALVQLYQAYKLDLPPSVDHPLISQLQSLPTEATNKTS
jgi:hypothetical protein